MEALYAMTFGDIVNVRTPFTLAVLAVGKSIRDYLFIYLLILAAFIIGYPILRQNPKVRLFENNILLRLPIIGRVIFYDSMGRFCQSFGQMLQRGVPVDAALMLAAGGVDSLISMKVAGLMSKSLGQGKSISRGMADTQLFAPLFVWMVQKAEERGDTAAAFLDLSDFYEEKFKDASGMISVLMEPVLLICIGLILAWFLVGLYMPMLEMLKLVR
jgi:type IV pilus assembly protein PilC